MLLAASSIHVSSAQELVYEPINPSFGGNPFNSSHLLALANAQNDFDPPVEPEDPGADLDRFIRSLESRLLSGLASEVSNAIFGDDAQESGRIVFGDQTIEFARSLEGIELRIIEADGSTTVITVPTLITDDGMNATGSSIGLAATGSSVSNSALSADPLAAAGAPPIN